MSFRIAGDALGTYLPEGWTFNDDMKAWTFNNNGVKNDEQDVHNGDIGPIIEDTAGPNSNDEQLEDITEKVKKLGISKFKKGACAIDLDSGAVLVVNTPGDYTQLIPVPSDIPAGSSKVPSLYVDGNGKSFVVSKIRDAIPNKVLKKLNDKMPKKVRDKVLKKAGDKARKKVSDAFKREAKISQKLREHGVHNILDITARKDLRTKLRMTFSTHCNRGDLADILIGGALSTVERTNLIPIMMQVADALKEMHAVGYCLLDLKPENIFLEGMEGNDVLHALLGDLGSVTKKGAKGTKMSHVTPEYCAPEVWGDGDEKKQHRAKPSMDVFSFGVTLFYVLHGMDDILFHGLVDPEGHVIGIDQSRPERVAEVQNWLRTGCQAECQEDRRTPFYELVAQCIAFDPKERPTMDEVYERLNEAWALHPSKNTSQA